MEIRGLSDLEGPERSFAAGLYITFEEIPLIQLIQLGNIFSAGWDLRTATCYEKISHLVEPNNSLHPLTVRVLTAHLAQRIEKGE